jgi:hypothetical protein
VLLCAVPFGVAGVLRPFAGRAAANVGATIAALHPALAFAGATLYPTALTTAALTLGVWWALHAVREGDGRAGAAAGIALGIAGAATTYMAAIGPAAALLAVSRRRFAVAALLLVASLAPSAAWTARNARTLGIFAPTSTIGFNLLAGANDAASPRSGTAYINDLVGSVGVSGPDGDRERVRDHAARTMARAWIGAHPVRWAWLCVQRAAVELVDPTGQPATPGAMTTMRAWIGWVVVTPLTLLGLCGLLAHRRRPEARLAMAALGIVVAAAAVTVAKPRFRYPCDPLLFGFAGVLAADVTSRRRAQGRSSTAAAPAGRSPAATP